MTNHEQQDPSQESRDLYARVRNFWKSIRRAPDAADSTAAVPAAPEKTILDMHRERVAAQVKTFFDAVDSRVGEWIGYQGNIREELLRRFPRSGYNKDLDLKGLDPSLQAYIHDNIFFFRQDNERDRPAAIYKIDCQGGTFTPSVYVETPDGFVDTTLFLGHHRDSFEQVQLRRVYSDNRVRIVGTFSSNPSAPPNPLTINQGTLPMPYSHAIYDNIDAAGNVSLLDGQTISDGSGYYTGRYSAADHTLTSVHSGQRVPYTFTEDHLLIGHIGQQTKVPLQTNIYTELESITGIIRTIAT